MKIEVSGGCFSYPRKERTVLADINFSLNTGDVLAILGPNGAGKTTLLRCIMGLLKWKSGETLLNETSLKTIPHKKIWQQISYVPQAKQALTAYTVEEMVLLGRASMVNSFSIPGKADMEAVDKAIEKTRLQNIRHRSCAELSGGEFQMVLIARALVSDPKILILDEPESNLDYQNQLLVLEMISQLSSEGIICIFNTHYPGHALRRGTKALMLSKGGNYCFGNVRDIVTEENILKYFGVRSVIGEFETEDATYSDVVPISIEENSDTVFPSDDRVIAGITVLMEGSVNADKLNDILHEYSGKIIGRMGLSYKKVGVNIITLTLDTSVKYVREISDEISRIPGTHVKTSYIAEGSEN